MTEKEREMAKNKQSSPWQSVRWIALDARGAIHARIYYCSRETAEFIGRLMFPEESLRIVGSPSDARQREAANQAPLLTREICERQGIDIPPDPKPPIGMLAHRLVQHFPRLRARGGR